MVRQGGFKAKNLWLYAAGALPVTWIALLLAPFWKDGLVGIVRGFGEAMSHPFHIEFCEDSFRAVLIFLLLYVVGIGMTLSSERNYRRREEHGSARWGDAEQIDRKYASKDRLMNKILTRNVAIGLDGRKHKRNLNVLVCGGSGAGKTRFYAKPNIMNANTSFVVLDPKGAIFKDNKFRAVFRHGFAQKKATSECQKTTLNSGFSAFLHATRKGGRSQYEREDHSAL